MLKRLWRIFGPVICALVLVVVVIYCYPQGRKHSYQTMKRNAVTLTTANFKSRINKTNALSDKNIVLYLSLVLVSGYVLMPFIQQF